MTDGRGQRVITRVATTVAVLVLVASAAPPDAAAASLVKASVVGSETVASGTWAATASTTSMVFTANSDQGSTVTNQGTLALSAISYKVTVSNPSSGSPTFTLYACALAWVANTCGGGAGTEAGSTLAKNSTTTVTSTVVPPVGGSVYLQFEPAGVTSSVTITLGTAITSPGQLRAAVKTSQ